MKKSLAITDAMLILSGCAPVPGMSYMKCQTGDKAACLAQYQFNLNAAGKTYADRQLEKDNKENMMLSCTPLDCTDK